MHKSDHLFCKGGIHHHLFAEAEIKTSKASNQKDVTAIVHSHLFVKEFWFDPCSSKTN